MSSNEDPRIARLQDRIEYLEGVNRHTTEALRLATTLGHFETGMSQLDSNEAILRETCARAHRLLPCKAMSIFLVDEQTADLEMSYCQPESWAGYLQQEFDHLVDSRSLAWALDRNAAYFAPSRMRNDTILLHPLATTSRIRGVFLGILETGLDDVADSMRLLFSIVMQSSANSLESFALYHLLQDVNSSLQEKVRLLAASEEAVTHSRDWLQSIFDVIPVGVNIVNSEYEILEISEKLLKYFNVSSREQLKGQKCYKVLKKRKSPCPECSMPEVLETGRMSERFSSEEEQAITKRSFKIFSTPLKSALAGGASKSVRAVAEFHLDVSDLRELEQALITARDEAQQANRAKSDFLASMSHEIRTPMNAIIGMSELALASGLDQEQQEFLETILDSSNHLLHLLNDILDFSKIEARKLELEQLDFDLHDTLWTVIRTLQPQAEEAENALELEILPNVLKHARGDAGRLRQVLLNLLGNAIKFTRKGAVQMRVEPAPAAMARPSERAQWLLFSVQDEGIGIPYDKQHHIFGEFYQAHSSLDRRYGGTGLGLAITQLLVSLMGGRIWLESSPGKGSCFFVLLPVQHGARQQQNNEPKLPQPEQDALPNKQLQVLLAEDNQVNARVATLFLERHGHGVVHAANGREVLACLEQQMFDLVLMDLEMPEMDGLEATRRIRAGQAGSTSANVRVVAMTAHAVAGYRERCLEAGMDDFLTKPVNFRSLQAILDTPQEIPTLPPLSPETSPVLDIQQCLDRIGGDTEILEDVMETFLADLPVKIARMREKMGADDLELFTQLAHAVKGSAATVGALRCSAKASMLEQAAKNADLDSLPALLLGLEEEIASIQAAMAENSISCKT